MRFGFLALRSGINLRAHPHENGLLSKDVTEHESGTKEFVQDLTTRQFRRGLRVRRVEGTDSIFEMT